MMNGLRRALLFALPLPQVARGPFLQAAAARGLCAFPREARRTLRRERGAALPLYQQGAPEEEFLFPEYLPEEPPDTEEALRERLLREREEEQRQDEERKRLRKARRQVQKVCGHPDPSVPSSGVSCSGCGAELHCRDPAAPGFLPSEKYLSLAGVRECEDGERKGGEEARSLNFKALEGAVCQRCWLLVHYQKALQVQMSWHEYRDIVSTALRSSLRHGRPPLVLCMVDMLDLPDSLLPDLPELIGTQAHLFILGNKVDLLPGDSPHYLKRLRERLLESCARAGLMDTRQPVGYQQQLSGMQDQPVIDIHLISAKTGYGVETLISKLQRSWKFNGDVYLVGATNTGKSTLFNTLLESDYCKSKASDAINRATISPWPGTTLNLLKFPIINPTPYRIFQRKERLKEDAEKTEEDLSEAEQKHLRTLKKQGYLIGRIGRTFKQPSNLEKNREIDFDPELLAFDGEEEPSHQSKPVAKKIELSHNEIKDARWFHDTPGIVKDGCILNLLNEKEIKLVLPTQAIVPRTFVLKPQMTLFLGALGRIDYLQGDHATWFSVVASNLLPVHITTTEKADAVYQNHAGQILLKVPMGGEERMKDFPSLVPQDVMLEGISAEEAVADIKFSSAGWVAVTAHSNKIHLRCYSPEGTTLTVRKPPLLPYIVHIKGIRVRGSAAYKTKKPPPFVENLKSDVKYGMEKGKKKSKI